MIWRRYFISQGPSFGSLKYEKERKGNFSNKSISFMITFVYWNTGLLLLIFLTLTAWNRRFIIQINPKGASFYRKKLKKHNKKKTVNNHRSPANLWFHFPWVSQIFPGKIYAFCSELHVNYLSFSLMPLHKIPPSKKERSDY